MFEIKNTLVSEEILKNQFVCNLNKCKGICCVEGDSGAPLEENELSIIKSLFPKIKHLLRDEALKSIENQGVYVIDEDGDYVTPLVENKECAYVIFDEKGITKCAFEKAYEDKLIDYKKPISCHLYPIRTKTYRDFDAINYDHWDICNDACSFGKELNIDVYKFLKEPLIRKYGKDWYEELEKVAIEYNK